MILILLRQNILFCFVYLIITWHIIQNPILAQTPEIGVIQSLYLNASKESEMYYVFYMHIARMCYVYVTLYIARMYYLVPQRSN